VPQELERRQLLLPQGDLCNLPQTDQGMSMKTLGVNSFKVTALEQRQRLWE
jgi:hypothetical protein